jgi:hypothetical protein
MSKQMIKKTPPPRKVTSVVTIDVKKPCNMFEHVAYMHRNLPTYIDVKKSRARQGIVTVQTNAVDNEIQFFKCSLQNLARVWANKGEKILAVSYVSNLVWILNWDWIMEFDIIKKTLKPDKYPSYTEVLDYTCIGKYLLDDLKEKVKNKEVNLLGLKLK